MFTLRPNRTVAAQADNWSVNQAFSSTENELVDQQLPLMDIDEKIGQLLLIRARSDTDADYGKSVHDIIATFSFQKSDSRTFWHAPRTFNF